MRLRLEQCVNPEFLELIRVDSEEFRISFFESEIVPKFMLLSGIKSVKLRSTDRMLIEIESRDLNTPLFRSEIKKTLESAFDRIIDLSYKELGITDYL